MTCKANRRLAAVWIAASLLGLSIAACQPNEATTGTTTPQNTSAQTRKGAAARPDAARLVERVARRWDLICRASNDSKLWIEAYDFEAPAAREAVSLANFIANKGNFHYDQPGEPRVLFIEDGTAYVNTTVLWLSGKHPALQAGNVLGADPNSVEFLDMVETWKWVDDDWYFLGPPARKNEFFDENPDFLARAQRANAGVTEPKEPEEAR